ncbi:MAG: hypothetical protein ACM3JG_08300 [Thiohalocapsa sp.]
MWKHIAQVSALMPLAAIWCEPAGAYRPFDGTDAAAAELHNLEIEVGPVEYTHQGDERMLITPNLRLNYGFAKGWEVVLEGETTHGLSAAARPISQVENGFFLKTVLREGVLQDQPGPSIATEFGVLMPGINDQHGAGGSLTGILSQSWKPITVHFNAAAAVTREQHADVFFSTILEGPHDWPFRPVAELAYEHDFGGTEIKSALIGAIWQARDNLAVDLGLRGGCVDHHTLAEIRAGLTFSFAMRSAPAGKNEGGER